MLNKRFQRLHDSFDGHYSCNTPHLMCIVIQNLVLGWSEGDPTGGERRTVRRPEGAGGAADIPPGACAPLALALILLSPVESHRSPIAGSTFSTQEKVHPDQNHESPDHIRCVKIREPYKKSTSDRNACLY